MSAHDLAAGPAEFAPEERTDFQREVAVAYRTKRELLEDRGHTFNAAELLDLYRDAQTRVRRYRRCKASEVANRRAGP